MDAVTEAMSPFRYFVRRQFAIKSAFSRDYITQDEAVRLLRLCYGLDKTDVRTDAQLRRSADTATRLSEDG
jgi:hypothetical protein